MAESKKSLFKPSHPRKYKGDITNIICRSTWEKKFCHYCDLNENVIEWGSEEFFIPYRAPDGKVRRYFPDFIMKVKESNGGTKTYVIEVKPAKQTRPPKKRKKVTSSYIIIRTSLPRPWLLPPLLLAPPQWQPSRHLA